ncbi:MAG: hypothetical protein ACK4NA_10830 [Alphaproteobacteria bacterium]
MIENDVEKDILKAGLASLFPANRPKDEEPFCSSFQRKLLANSDQDAAMRVA